ncbi:DUF2917 domain-containing protein [Pseudoduganella sp. FT25W]|uniref:DUF2917 domain-containing protein n=1 Tax=Duganella alba TaxID=2666081 RepID=A0A6L5QGS6_9BURK|nr:DUF2917 domain-containing protein [Duganella alba]MRX08840.1 DUF2917 domain-containing protein [Duganella alba]MRX18866.1 DUF2917 domain-containing protein [Duganella alba]
MKPQLISIQQGQAEYRLTHNHPLRLARVAGRRIECLSGTAWITAYGERTDFMLRGGQSFEVPNDGLMLIEAVGAGVARVRLPHAPKSLFSRAVGFLLRN